MKLIVGLGNPGPQYQLTRHNIGFMLVDALVEACHGNRDFKSEFKSFTQKIQLAGETVLLVKPQTFMNLSGEAVQPLMAFYRRIPLAHYRTDFYPAAFRFRPLGEACLNYIGNSAARLGNFWPLSKF